MDLGSQQSRLETVSSLASTLADQLLSECLEGGPLSPEKGDVLKQASLLLEQCEHPIPDVVSDALAQIQRDDPIEVEDSEIEDSSSDDHLAASGAKGAFMRFIRSVRPAASA